MLKVFEVKIYPYSQKEFERKVKKKNEKVYSTNPNYPVDMFYKDYGAKTSFEDYSIGHIDVYLDGAEVIYEARIMISERRDKQYISKELEKIETAGLSEREYLARKIEVSSSHEKIAYKPRLFTDVKHYTQAWHIDRCTSHYIDNMSANEIVEAIRNRLQEINRMHFYRNLYFDLSNIDNIGECLDFTKLIEKSKEVYNG